MLPTTILTRDARCGWRRSLLKNGVVKMGRGEYETVHGVMREETIFYVNVNESPDGDDGINGTFLCFNY